MKHYTSLEGDMKVTLDVGYIGGRAIRSKVVERADQKQVQHGREGADNKSAASTFGTGPGLRTKMPRRPQENATHTDCVHGAPRHRVRQDDAGGEDGVRTCGHKPIALSSRDKVGDAAKIVILEPDELRTKGHDPEYKTYHAAPRIRMGPEANPEASQDYMQRRTRISTTSRRATCTTWWGRWARC